MEDKKRNGKKGFLFAVLAVIGMVVVALFVGDKAKASETKKGSGSGSADGGGKDGNGNVPSDTKEFCYSYTRDGKTYKITSKGVKMMQQRILDVYQSYNGNSKYLAFYIAAKAMKEAGGADGKLGAKTKAAFDASTWSELLKNSKVVSGQHYYTV